MAQVDIILFFSSCREVRKYFYSTEFSDAVSNVSENSCLLVKIMQKIER